MYKMYQNISVIYGKKYNIFSQLELKQINTIREIRV